MSEVVIEKKTEAQQDAQPAQTTTTTVVDTAAPSPEDTAKSAGQKIDFDKLSAEDKNELLDKISGGKYKSVEDLTPPAQKTSQQLAEEKEKKNANAVAWALENGKIKKSDYDRLTTEKTKNDQDLTFALFSASVKEDDKDLSDEDVLEMFKDHYHLESEETNPRLFKAGQKAIQKEANQYRKENFSAIDDLPGEYDNFLSVQDQYGNYKSVVKKVSAELPKEFKFELPFKNVDGKEETLSYTIPVDDKDIAKLAADFANQKQFHLENLTANGKFEDKEYVKKMTFALKSIAFDKIIPILLAKNAEDVETRTIAMLGNKRVESPSFNNGRQVNQKAAVENKGYPRLERAVAEGRV